MRKRNKAYRPKKVDRGSAFLTMSMQKPLSPDQVRDLSLSYRAALAAITAGVGDEGHLHVLACSLNIGLVMAENGFGKEFERDFIVAQEGIVRAMARHKQTGKVGVDGPALVAIKEAFDLHDQQIEIATAGAVKAALLEVYDRMRKQQVFEVPA